VPYSYANGTFYQPASGGGYTVAAPPSGAQIATLPTGYTTVSQQGSNTKYFYYQGYYYGSVSTGGYVVVKPPAGITVPYLPQGATAQSNNGASVFTYNGVTYKAAYVGGEVVYETQ